MKKLYISAILLLLFFTASAQNYPYVMGYAGGQQVFCDSGIDTVIVSYSGGAPFATKWVNTTDGFVALQGFRHNIIYVQNVFNKDLFASKGYYTDYVELKWEVANYESVITGFKVYRKELNQPGDSVLVANLAPTLRSWRDDYAESNVIYKYTLVARGVTNFNQKMLNFVDGVGFRVPYGRIYGRVTYRGGTAVKGVHMIAETEDNFSGTSIKLNGTNSYIAVQPAMDDPHFKFENKFAFQAWYKSNSASTACLFEKPGQYKITHAPGQLNFTAGTQTVTLNFTEKIDTFFNVTAIRTADSIKIFAIYDYQTFYVAKAKLTSATPANNDAVFIGKSSAGEYFNGWVDEARLWYRSFSDTYAIESAGMYIAGTEDSLSAYYRMNEATGNVMYDLSRKGFSFNEMHGFVYSSTWSNVVPFSRQLAVKGITDSNGNYIISGIPYKTDGSTYRIVPVFGTHTFDPTEKLLFIGPGSTNHSNIDFIDIASFSVSARVKYKNTDFGVADAFIKIDGSTAVTAEGSAIITNSDGYFNIDVPIGNHFISIAKQNHIFEFNGRFPSTEGDFYNFQANNPYIPDFIDITTVKVIGRVAGGPVEAAKPAGLGKTVNNIGNAKLVLGTVKNKDLRYPADNYNATWENYSYQNSTLVDKGNTDYKYLISLPKQIEIYPDPITGEYFAYLLPEKYIVKSISAGVGNDFDASFLTVIDLSSALLNRTIIDSVKLNPIISPTGDTTYTYRIDSVSYNQIKDFILRKKPVISVKNRINQPDFWEKTVTAKDDSVVTVVDATGKPLTNYPIFIQRKNYDLKISVFESYYNPDNSITDNVPVTDGTVKIQNFLSLNEELQQFQINSFGVVNYSFKAGLPNITTGGIGDYLKTMSIVAFTGQNGAIATDWFPGGSGIYDWLAVDVPFRGYVLGGLPTGNNFVTLGPTEIDMILRDPNGSGSYSYWEQGSSVAKSTTYSAENTASVGAEFKFQFGAGVKTFAGIGAGIITEYEYDNSTTIGLTLESQWVNDNTKTTTITNTERWSTSGEADFVGANGDVFIGHSTNIVYGKSNFIDLVPETSCVGCVSDGLSGYSIGTHIGIRLNPVFSTGFMYSQSHIKDYLIPNLQMLRNLYLHNSPYYTSVLAEDNPEYGRNNTNEVKTDAGTGTSGDSYNYIIPASWANGVEFVDTIRFYNKQIEDWEKLLARNEREKLTAKLLRNHSFDAGVIYENSVTYDSSTVTNSSFTFTVSPSIAYETGFTFNKFGMEMALNASYSHASTWSDGTDSTFSVTFGYSLSDPDPGDYFSIDVKDPIAQTGPVFILRGGQSACPYEPAVYTEYNEPIGALISAATMQREKPEISVENSIVANIPEDQAALFNFQLRNISETGEDSWFFLLIDETTNQNGALVEMDGSAIGNGRLIRIPSGVTINKTISVKKTNPIENDYENIGLILQSVCQEDISDTVTISAHFQPVCTRVDISQVLNNWLINTNTGTNLNIGIDNYNLNHATFEKVAFQYKSSTSSQWITDHIFYKDLDDFNASTETNKTYINGMSSLIYTWDMLQLEDRNYDILLQTQCSDGTTNNSTILKGVKDTKRPKVFGTPQPADGILSPGDDIMITFNENIDEETLLKSKFSVRGVLNGANISHNSCIYFDGNDDYLSNIQGVNLTEKSFTVEFWANRADNSPAIIFSQANIEIGFNASNNLYIKLNSQTITSVETFTMADSWVHYAISFNNLAKEIAMYATPYNTPLMENVLVTSPFEGNGRMYIGKNETGSEYFNGYLHDFRIWEKPIGFGSAVSNMNKTLSGSEVGLSGLWLMNEASGEYAQDLARSHNALLVGASWRVFPTGYARTFNGINEYISISTASTVVISDEMDYTIEFWFKGGNQTNTVLFSNGQGDGTDVSPSIANSLNIGFDNLGHLYFKNNGIKITIANQNYLNNTWNHLALVLNRNGNANLYINGELKAYEQSLNFGGVVGPNMSIGARRKYIAGVTSYDQYFSGSIDEFRIWKLARTSKLLKMDMSSKLKGNEVGLVAYYPFDKYDAIFILQPSLNNCDFEDDGTASTLIATATGGAFDNTNVPNIKDARPIEIITAFDYVVNNDKIVINIQEDPERIEKCILEFTAERIEDMHENRLASPVTWTAYINKNTVIWNTNSLEFQKEVNLPLSFTAVIKNIGGTEQNFEINNLPNWLTASVTAGTLMPLGSQIITFNINPSTNIGNYEASIFLTSNLGYNEKLNIKLKVFAIAPNWYVDPGVYQYSMSVIGQIKIDGILSSNPDDILGAFVNGECRGSAKLSYMRNYDLFEAFLNVYSNTENGEAVTFKIWNAARGVVHENVTNNGNSSITFQSNTLIGTPATPEIFETSNSYSREIELINGWKWISVNLTDPNLSNINALFANINSVNDNLIKGQRVFDIYNNLTGWRGSLSNTGGLKYEEMYMVKLSVKDTLKIVGAKLSTLNTPITLKTGWNWIGYTPTVNIDVADALGNYNAKVGDIIKSQYNFSYFDPNLGWTGSLTSLEPGKGYMYKNTGLAIDTIVFPESSLGRRLSDIKNNEDVIVENWQFVPENYQFNESLIGILNFGSEIITQNHIIGAFSNNECRGIAQPMSVGGEMVYFMSIYSNNPDENISFKLFDDATNIEYSINESIVFINNDLVGTPDNPFVFTVNQSISNVASQSLDEKISIVPNISDGRFNIYASEKNLGLEDGTYVVKDMLGKTIHSGSIKKSKTEIDLTDKAKGVYMLSIKINNQVLNKKLVIQ